MKRLLIIAATTVLFVPIASAQTAPATGSAPAAAVAPKEKKICRGIAPTGSFISQSFCLTKSEWAELNRLSAQNAENAMKNRINNLPGSIQTP